MTGVGELELRNIETALAARHEASKTQSTRPPLPGNVKAQLGTIACYWVVDSDQSFNVMEQKSFQTMMSTATSGAWCGCCQVNVAQNITMQSGDGHGDCKDFVLAIQADGRKVAVFADLWSKNGVALLGSLFHGILRPGNAQPWIMDEKLASAIIMPCSKCRHIGEYVKTSTFDE